MSRYFKGVDLTEEEDEMIYSTWAEAGKRIREKERQGLISPSSTDVEATTFRAQVAIGTYVLMKFLLAEEAKKKADNAPARSSGPD